MCSCSNTPTKEEMYNSRVSEAISLYDNLCKAITIINDNSDKYRQATAVTINNGTFSEDGDEEAFNHSRQQHDPQVTHSLRYYDQHCSGVWRS